MQLHSTPSRHGIHSIIRMEILYIEVNEVECHLKLMHSIAHNRLPSHTSCENIEWWNTITHKLMPFHTRKSQSKWLHQFRMKIHYKQVNEIGCHSILMHSITHNWLPSHTSWNLEWNPITHILMPFHIGKSHSKWLHPKIPCHAIVSPFHTRFHIIHINESYHCNWSIKV